MPVDASRTGLEVEVDEIKHSLAAFQKEMRTEIKALSNQISQRDRTNWPVLLSVFALIVTLAGGAFFVVKQEVSSRVSPLEASSRVSEMDRLKLNSEHYRVAAELARLEREITVTQSSLKDQLVEVESQFRAIGQMQNMRHASNQQLFGLLWQQTFNSQLPMSSYYPDMSRNKSQ